MSEASQYALLRRLRWPNGISCPFCGRSRVTTHSRSARTSRRRYLCLVCRRTFTDFTGTALARTNLPLDTWCCCLRLVGSGWRTAELARELEVKWDTAAHMERRLRAALARPGLLRELRDALEKNSED